MSRRGFSALEVLIAAAIFAVAIAAVSSLFSRMTKESGVLQKRQGASEQMRKLMEDIRREWKYRIKDTDPTLQPFTVSGPVACRGIIINQRTSTGTRAVEFVSECQTSPVPAKNPGPHTWIPDLGCIPRVVQRVGTTIIRTYPFNAGEGYGTVNCFTYTNPTPAKAEIRVRAVGLFLNSNKTRNEGAETVLDGNDRNPGIELLRF